MRDPNKVLQHDDTLLVAAGLDGSDQYKRTTDKMAKLGPSLYAQVIAILDDNAMGYPVNDEDEHRRQKLWRGDGLDNNVRIYMAGCAFLTALDSVLEPRERIMRLLMDFILLKEEEAEVDDYQIVQYLRMMAQGVDLVEGERWHPAFFCPSRRPPTHKLLLDSSPPPPAAG